MSGKATKELSTQNIDYLNYSQNFPYACKHFYVHNTVQTGRSLMNRINYHRYLNYANEQLESTSFQEVLQLWYSWMLLQGHKLL